MHVNDLLKIAVDNGASDLHLKVGSFPMLRVRGQLVPALSDKRLDHEDMLAMAATVLPTSLRDKFKEQHEVDLAYSVAGLGRFRCNAFQQRGTIGMIFRVIPFGVPSIDELALPPVLKRIAAEERGLLLVTGTTGSGKSTTLAALVDEINAMRAAVNLQPYTGPTDATAIKNLVIDERRRVLFVEGFRNYDIQRFSLPLNPAVGSTYPRVGGSYGNTTCLPLPDVERFNNPSITP